MPITTSAKKAHRASLKKRVFNLRRKDAISTVTKQLKKLVAEGKGKEAEALLPKVYQALDKAAKTKYLKKNTVARKKSRFAALIKRSIKK